MGRNSKRSGDWSEDQTLSLAPQAPRSASTICMRAARSAGRKPPIKPISSENSGASTAIPGVSVKPNASSGKDWKLVVENDKNCISEAKPRPAMPPTPASSSDSLRNAARMVLR